MNNTRDILKQILDIIRSSRGRGREVDDFCTFIEVKVMTDLIEALPEEKHKQIIDQWLAMPEVSEKAENILSPYYTLDQMREALKKATKKEIAKRIVEPHNPQLSPSQRESILTLLEKLT